jgi:type I restriction enzyme S subunit
MKTAPLGDLVEILSGFAFDSEQFSDEDGLPLIRIRDVVRGHTETFYRGKYDERYVIADGDLLIGMDGEFNTARWKGGRALLNQRVCRIAATDSRLDPGYLFFFLPAALKKIEAVTPFVTVKHLSVKDIRAITMPLPPLAEQKRIAAVLDKADDLRSKRRQALATLDTLLQSVFLDMFGDPVTKMVPLAQITEEFRYGTSVKSESTGYPTLRIPNVIGSTIDVDDLKLVPVEVAEAERLRLLDGDVLFVRTNGNPDFVGRSAVFDASHPPIAALGHTQWIYASYLIRARIDRTALEPVVLQAFLSSEKGRQRLRAQCKTSAGQYNINTEGLGGIPVPVPPMAEQRRFVSVSKSIAERRVLLESAARQADTLFAVLQSGAFAGTLFNGEMVKAAASKSAHPTPRPPNPAAV